MYIFFSIIRRFYFVVVVQPLSHVWLCDPMECPTPGFPVLHYLLEVAPIHIHWVCDGCYLIISYSATLFSFCLQSFPTSGSFPRADALHIRWPKYWSFSFNISPSNEYPRLISFRMDCFDLLAVKGTLRSLPQNHSLEASIL